MRCFLAVPVVPPALDEGLRLLDRLQRRVPDVRWVRSEGLHLTLHFFQSLDEPGVPRVLDAAAEAAARVAPYDAVLGGMGCFPRDGDERVLWIGMRDGAEQTVALQAAVESSLAARGFAGEERAFRPHVTVGRPRARFGEAVRREWKRFADAELPPFPVEEVTLFRSHPGPGGSRYEVLGRVPLGVSV